MTTLPEQPEEDALLNALGAAQRLHEDQAAQATLEGGGALPSLEGPEREEALTVLARDPVARAAIFEPQAPVSQAQRDQALQALAPRRRRLWWAPAIAAAAAVLLAVGLWLPREEALAPYTFDRIEGGVQAVRGEARPSAEFVPASQIFIVMAPRAGSEQAGPARKVARVLTSAADGPLKLAPAEVLSPAEGGGLILETSGQVLFGDAFGPQRLYVAFAAEPGALVALDGQPVSALKSTEITWLTLDVDYQKPPDSP